MSQKFRNIEVLDIGFRTSFVEILPSIFFSSVTSLNDRLSSSDIIIIIILKLKISFPELF
jgi:hypothetical protein